MNAEVEYYEISGPAIISKDFGTEVVVANLNSGIFYSLNGSGTAIWTDLAAGRSVESIVGSFATSGEAASGIKAFVRDLVAEELIVPMARGNASSAASAPRAYEAPSLERFEDLQGLLLVDPIHEVGEAGWPMQPSDDAPPLSPGDR